MLPKDRDHAGALSGRSGVDITKETGKKHKIVVDQDRPVGQESTLFRRCRMRPDGARRQLRAFFSPV
jgi:hypothetical protein